MEGFLSLPRSAKGGLAVLLAVALLGWAIVAYSAKQQHEDTRTLEQAITALKAQGEREQSTLAEAEDVRERLAVAEDELAGSRDAMAASREEKSEVEAKLAGLEAEIAGLRTAAGGEGGALTLLQSGSGADGEEAADPEKSAEADALRARLTSSMTKLSARSVTLQQRGRALSQAEADLDAAAAEIEALKGAVLERDTLRARLTGTMTALSAKGATLQQREQELGRLKADHEEALASIEGLDTSLAERDVAGRSLDTLTAKLGRTRQALDDGAKALENNQQARADQKLRLQELMDEQASVESAIEAKRGELAGMADGFAEEEAQLAEKRQEIEAVEAELADLDAAKADGEALSSSLMAEVDARQTLLTEKEDAIAYAEADLERLQGEIVNAEERLTARHAELQEAASRFNEHETAIRGVEASLAAVKADRAIAEAETLELRTAIDRQQTVIRDLAVLKGEIATAEARLEDVNSAAEGGAAPQQTLARIPIAAVSQDNLAILPIDPTQHPFPVQTEGGIRLGLVHFDLGSAELTPGGLRRAREAAAWIKAQNVAKIKLVGATDTVGTRENNMALAQRRAQTLFDTFAAEGIDPARIELVSMGEAGGGEAISDQTAEPLNRCVGIFIETEG